MKASSPAVRRILRADDAILQGLCDVLIDCVEGGASVSFMLPLTRERAMSFWQKVVADVEIGSRALLVAEDGSGICGTVQLCFDLPDNQPHRADVAKMLVHRRARHRGLGAALLVAAEAVARENGRTLLVLDSVTGGDGARLYERQGWTRVGDIPKFALWPQGGYVSTTYYYRDLSG
jgi:GNAT superfamily N-acetyltransferase